MEDAENCWRHASDDPDFETAAVWGVRAPLPSQFLNWAATQNDGARLRTD